MPAEVTIGEIREVATPGPGGAPVPSMRVEYFIGDDGPFSITVRTSEFSDAKVREEIKRVTDEVNKLKGTK